MRMRDEGRWGPRHAEGNREPMENRKGGRRQEAEDGDGRRRRKEEGGRGWGKGEGGRGNEEYEVGSRRKRNMKYEGAQWPCRMPPQASRMGHRDIGPVGADRPILRP